MSPRKKRPISKVDLTPYLVDDIVTVKPKDGLLRVEIGSDRCRTLVTDEQTTLLLVLTLIKQGTLTWGTPFMAKVLTQIEVL